MDLNELLSRYYRDDERTKQIIEQVENNSPVTLHLKGVTGSALSFIAYGVFKNSASHHLFILNDREEAAYFLNDLENLLEKKDILFIPDSFKRPGFYDEVNTNNVLLRTEAINKISHSSTKGELIVTYPEALVEKFVMPQAFEKKIIFLKKGERLDDHFIIELLIENGFERTDFVYEPGQFSVRGGIIDIFSFGNEQPYRIELFDDEVESIRVFDPATQLSQKNIAQVTIVPNIQTQFDTGQKASLFNCLPAKTVIWYKDAKYTFEVINKCYETAIDFYNVMTRSQHLDEDHPFKNAPPVEMLVEPGSLVTEVTKFSLIEFGLQCNLNNAIELAFNIMPQPLFTRNFDMLIENLRQNKKEGNDIFIFMSNAKQVERFHQIFTDLSANIQYTPIPKALSSGFIDNDLKITCYTDHQIFERFHKYHLKSGFSKNEALTLRMLLELQPGDFVTHIDHGIGRYSGLEKIEIKGHVQEAVRLIYRDKDLLYVNINSLHKISKYTGDEKRNF